mmetsp:Transcript_31147/g.73421  ORF Transcript_31147/g.73421 Transcript_31147/m.73421 type:complete len:650 (-) Transcript_31147:206-2155(-)
MQFPVHTPQHPRQPPATHTSLQTTSSLSNVVYGSESSEANATRPHKQDLEESQNQAEKFRHQEYPIVWRWVPFTAPDSAVCHATTSPSLLQPRVIYATAKRNEATNRKDLPSFISGGELLHPRGVPTRTKVESLVASKPESSTVPLRIPEVPVMVPSHVNLPPQRVLLDPHNHRVPMVPNDAPSCVVSSTNSADTTSRRISSVNEAGGELEVANLLLNMGGRSPRSENIATIKNEPVSRNSVSGPKIQGAKATATATATGSKTPVVEDVYLDKWVSGSVSLHTPEDDDVLSPLHCFMRRYCVEAFSATPEDVATPRYGKSHGFKVEVGQVGIRCLHCKDLPPDKRAERAVCYPSSLRNIYHSIETWQRRHSLLCKCITPWVRKSILELMESSKTRAGGRRQYWEDSARRLGMVDTSQGVRFCRKPGDLGPIPSSVSGRAPGDQQVPQHKPEEVVRQEDKDLVTDYLFLLMDQMQTCRFTEEDRTGGRSKIKNNEVGFPGMECRHCQGRAGFGRYFPSSVAALSLANSDRNVYNHLQKCRKCPESIKAELVRLQKDQAQSKNRRGLRKLFFNRIWKRMHVDDEKDEGKDQKSSSLSATTMAPKTPSDLPAEYVQYNGMPRPMHGLPPTMITHSYQRSLHPRVAVNNFRGY